MDTSDTGEMSHVVKFEDLAGLSADEIIKVLDLSWPWPMSAVQDWFENLWNNLVSWFTDIGKWFVNTAGSIWETIKGWIDTAWHDITDWTARIWTLLYNAGANTWDWLKSTGETIIASVGSFITTILHGLQDGINFITGHIGTYFQWIYTWLIDQFKAVADTVQKINDWFSNEFIDPFIDWLTGLPGQLWAAFVPVITSIGHNIATWLSSVFGSIGGVLSQWLGVIGRGLQSVLNWLGTGIADYIKIYDKNYFNKPMWMQVIEALEIAIITVLGGWFVVEMAPLVVDFFGSLGALIDEAAPSIGVWFASICSKIGGWLAAAGSGIGTWAAGILPRIAGWFVANIVGLLGSGTILTLEATGKLEQIIGKYVTPAITGVFDMFEAMGPVAPAAGKDMSTGITKLATFTISGLAAFTLAGEMLSPLKQIGLGHVSAIIYDLINYRTLTAAFMGVLAFIYIKTPLTYYYNKVARPTIPDERGLSELASRYQLTQGDYQEFMSYHGYPDIWTEKMYTESFRPLTPYLLRSLATADILDDTLLDNELRHAGYRPETIPYIKKMMTNLASGTLKQGSTGTAMTRYQEGFDDEPTLRSNLAALGVSDKMMDRYVFAANLQYFYDYQSDLKSYYLDAYHRRDIEEDELRQDLTSVGLLPERIDLVVSAQAIKRLKAPAKAVDPTLTVQEATIRERRTKNLITRDVEIQQLITIGVELSLATAYADQDDVKLLPKVPSVEVSPLPVYKTDTGKIQVDTVRWNRRKGYIDAPTEQSQLVALEMPAAEATAMVEEDTVMIASNKIEKPPLALPYYQTEAGKVEVDTVRRIARSQGISYEDEISSLEALEMSPTLATAIADNDQLRLKKAASGG